ncbi:MAG: DMT family transporter [Lachnospiraceae bacterium]|nr:DMT family transporter [Lachnospiraceae bacterium]
MTRRTSGIVLAISGGTCWGLSGAMGQYLFTREAMDSRWLVPIRLGLAGCLLFVYCLFRYGRKTFEPLRLGRDRRELLIYGIPGVSLCQFLYFLTIQQAGAGVGTILQDLSPVLILLYTCRKEKRRAGLREVICVLLAFFGVSLITTHGTFGALAVPLGALATGILSAVCVTVYNVEPERLLTKYPVVMLQAYAFLMGGALLGLLFHPWTWGYIPDSRGYFGIAFVVLVGNVLAFTAYMSGVSRIGPEKAILYGFAEPVTAAIIGTVLLGSRFTIWDGIGFAAIFMMMFLISCQPKSAQGGR